MKNQRFSTMLLLGYGGFGNFGDDIILLSLLKCIDASVAVNVKCFIYLRGGYLNIELSRMSLSRTRISVVNSMIGVFYAFLCSSLIMVYGGDHIHDYGKLVKRIKIFVLFTLLALCSRLLFKRIVIVNTGVRISSHLGASLTKLCLSLFNKISVRDVNSYYSLLKIGIRNVILGFDTAVLYYPFIARPSSRSNSSTSLAIGVSLTPAFKLYFSKPNLDSMLVQSFSHMLEDIIEGLKRIKSEVHINLLCLNFDKIAGDFSLLTEMIKNIRPQFRRNVHLLIYNGSVSKFLEAFSAMNVIIGCKYHSILLSYMMMKPTVVLSYHPKNKALATEIGIPQKFVFSLDDFAANNLRWKACKKMLFALDKLLSSCREMHFTLPLSVAVKRSLRGVVYCLNLR
mgnify:CR=1 FL=1